MVSPLQLKGLSGVHETRDVVGKKGGGACYKPLFSVVGLVGALSLGNKSMAGLIGILGSKSSVAQNRIPSQRLLLRLTTEELFYLLLKGVRMPRLYRRELSRTLLESPVLSWSLP